MKKEEQHEQEEQDDEEGMKTSSEQRENGGSLCFQTGERETLQQNGTNMEGSVLLRQVREKHCNKTEQTWKALFC